MYYPDPLTVRMVKQTLKDTAKDMAIVGATSVVESVMGTLWGHLFTRNNSREYLNFIGELAGRTLSPNVQRFATQVYKNSNAVVDRNGKLVVHIPAEIHNNALLNDDGSYRQNNHKYDVIGIDTDITGKFKHNYKTLQPKSYSKPQIDKPKDSKPKTPQVNLVKQDKPALPKPQDHSEHLLQALDEMSSKPFDFSFASFFYGIKNKIMNAIGSRKKDDYAKDVLKGCYEYLEESGYDAYPVMLDILNKNSVDFSEKVELAVKSDLSLDLADFKKSAMMYKSLDLDQKKILSDYLSGIIGSEVANEYLWDMSKYNDTCVPPTKKKLGIFKVLSVIAIVLSALSVMFIRPKQNN